MNERQKKIIEAAREVLGTPFHHQGRVPHAGLDCIGVLTHVATRVNLRHIDYSGYKRVAKQSVLSKHLERAGCKCLGDPKNARPGDIVTFWFQIEGVENHVAVVGLAPTNNRRTLIHSFASSGGVVEHDYNKYWRDRAMRAWRFPEETV